MPPFFHLLQFLFSCVIFLLYVFVLLVELAFVFVKMSSRKTAPKASSSWSFLVGVAFLPLDLGRMVFSSGEMMLNWLNME